MSKLTPRQRKFCEALAADPDRNQSKAAEAAGYGGNAGVNGARLIRLDKVQQYLATLTKKAIRKANEDTEDAVGTLAENLTILTSQARMKAPWKVMRRAEDGTLNVFEPGKAASKIVDHYNALGDAGKDKGNRTLVVNFVGDMPQERRRELAIGLLAGSNGNGHGPS